MKSIHLSHERFPRKVVIDGHIATYYSSSGEVVNEFRFQKIRCRDNKIYLVVGNDRVILDWFGITIKPVKRSRIPIVFTGL